MASKNNPDVRKAKTGSSDVPMRHPKECFTCGGTIAFVKEQEMVMVGRRMKARHKGECPKA